MTTPGQQQPPQMAPHSQNASASAPTTPLARPAPAPAPEEGSRYLALIVPYEEGERQASAMETWFQACTSDEPFALELVGTRREQGFVLRASSEAQLVHLIKQFEGQYPQAEVQRIDPRADMLRIGAGEHVVMGEFALARKTYLPLKTFSGEALSAPGGDPMAGILAAMEPLASGERVICQLALVHAPDSWIGADLRKAVEHPLQPERDAQAPLRSGTSASSDTTEGVKLALLALGALAALLGYRLYQGRAYATLALLALLLALAGVGFLWWRVRHSRHPLYDMKLVNDKLLRAAFYTQLRVMVIGPQATSSPEGLMAHLTRLEVAYRQLALASANSLYLKRVRHLFASDRAATFLIHPLYAFPYHCLLLRFLHRWAYGSDVWNGLELAGPFHLPQELAEFPLVRRIAVKHLVASPEIAHQIERAAAPQPPARIGLSAHRGLRVPVYLPFDTLYRHKFLVGKSRTGKSVLIQLLLWAAMQATSDGSPQPGIFVMDPHHDLYRDAMALVARLPGKTLADILSLDLTDGQRPIGINPLDASMGFSRDQATANFISSVERTWGEYYGPRMAFFLRNVFLTLYTLNERLVAAGRAEEQYTLLDINPVLQYEDYARIVLSQLDLSDIWHCELLAWWQNTYFTLPKTSSFRQEVIMPILSKMAVFADNQTLRRIIGQPVTRAPVHEAITQGKIVLCGLSSRDMDDMSLNVIGSTLINLLHRSFHLQEHLPLGQRRKVFVAIDEFQAFSGADYNRLLSEDAKFGCATLLSTQYLRQLNEIRKGLLDVVLANCENLFAFNVSAADAKILEEELQEKVSQKHIISQPRLHCYSRLAIAGYPVQIASVELSRPASWQRGPTAHGLEQGIQRANQRRFLSAAEVDRLHEAHLKRFLDVTLFAAKLDREVGAMQQQQQKRASATSLADYARQPENRIPLARATPGAHAAAPATVPPGTNGSPSTADGTGGDEQAQDASPGKRKRKRPRSRRLRQLNNVRKTPVGEPLPPGQQPVPDELLSEEQTTQTAPTGRSPLPFPLVKRSGGEGREGRERSGA